MLSELKNCLLIEIQGEINNLTKLANNEVGLVRELTNQVLNQKWPKRDDEIAIFRFLFECNNFMRVFVLIGKYYTNKELF